MFQRLRNPLRNRLTLCIAWTHTAYTWARAEANSEIALIVTSLELSQFEAILFDLDSTLTHTGEYAFKACEWLLSKTAEDTLDIRELYFRSLFSNYRIEIERIVNGAPYVTPTKCVRNALRKSLEDVGLAVVSSLLDEVTDMFRKLHVELAKPMPGTEALLQRLSANGIKMGVITNSFVGDVKTILGALDLSRFFTVLIDSGDMNAFKPMPEIFEYAMRGLGVTKNKVLFIGDEYYADIVGAARTGIPSVWVNVRRSSYEKSLAKYGDDTAPLLVLDTLAELGNHI
jgi:putative hydrolase of the HAD superfamily